MAELELVIMQPELKILLSVHACSPKHGSEPGMGWNFVSMLSRYHDLHVITEEAKWKEDIENELNQNPELRKKVKFYFIKKNRHTVLRKLWPPSYYMDYRRWQKKAYALAVELERKENFNLVHQLNMAGYREPGYLWKIKKPFVWGPIGGLEDVDFKLLLNLDLRGFIYYSARTIINQWQKRYSQRPRKAALRDSNLLIAATGGDKKFIKKYWNKEAVIISEVGQELTPAFAPSVRKSDEPLKIVWSGQHTAGKALNILIKSLKEMSSDVQWKLSVLGNGRMTGKWRVLAGKYNIDSKCTWHGWLPKEEAHRVMRESHVLCITSIKDLTSTVTLEGLSFGLPVICIDHCGFGNVVNEYCGIKIQVDYPWTLIRNLTNAIKTLYSDEPLRQKLAYGSLQRASEYSWEKKAAEINRIYRSLM